MTERLLMHKKTMEPTFPRFFVFPATQPLPKVCACVMPRIKP